MFFIPALVVLLAVGLLPARAFTDCPMYPEGSPCRCRLDYSEVTVNCRGFTDTQALITEVQRFKGQAVDTLTLEDMDIDFLPQGLFLGTSVRRLNIEHSNLNNLYDTGTTHVCPFEGLEDSLEAIRVVDTRDFHKWDWPNMSDMRQLKTFIIVRSRIDFIGQFFANMGGGSLEVITAAHSGVKMIHPEAFQELSDMRWADFAFNDIQDLERTMFPNPAPRLETLNFRNNKLTSLSNNMFENMPVLLFLDFSENKFKAFTADAFKPVWNQLEYFYISKNPYRCDCSIRPLWETFVFGPRPSQDDLGIVTCELDGKKQSLKDLSPDSLQC